MSNPDILKISEHQDLKKAEVDREALRKIFVEYDSSEDLFNIQISSTHEITPEDASCLVSLLVEAQRIRAEYFRTYGKGN